MIFSIIYSIIVFLIFLSFEIILRNTNIKKTTSPINIITFSLSIFFLLSFILEIFVDINIERYCVSLVYYILGIIIYLHIFIGVSKSVSLRIMDEIYKSKNKELSLDELSKYYSVDDFFNKRIKLMLLNKWIFIKNNVYFCSTKGKFLVKINLFFLSLYKIMNSG